MILLRKSSVQQLFEGYTYIEEAKELEHHTTSSELHRRREGSLKSEEAHKINK